MKDFLDVFHFFFSVTFENIFQPICDSNIQLCWHTIFKLGFNNGN